MKKIYKIIKQIEGKSIADVLKREKSAEIIEVFYVSPTNVNENMGFNNKK